MEKENHRPTPDAAKSEIPRKKKTKLLNPEEELLKLKQAAARKLFKKDLQAGLNIVNGSKLFCGCPMCTDYMACNYEEEDFNRDRYWDKDPKREKGSKIVIGEPEEIRDCRLVAYFAKKCAEFGLPTPDLDEVDDAPRNFKLTTRLGFDGGACGTWNEKVKSRSYAEQLSFYRMIHAILIMDAYGENESFEEWFTVGDCSLLP